VAGSVLEQILNDAPQAVRIPPHERTRGGQVAVDHKLRVPGARREHRGVGDVPEVDVGDRREEP
jgi:hypothetical protein